MFTILCGVVSVLMTAAASGGLFLPYIYRDNALVRAGWFGNDLVTLLVVVPLLAGATMLARRGSTRGILVSLGLLAYAAYNYAFYVFGAAFNSLFLLYVAILVGSTLGLIAGMVSGPLHDVVYVVEVRPIHRAVGIVIATIASGLGAFWIALSLGYVMGGEIPFIVTATDHPTNVTGALDLWFVVTFGLLGGVWLAAGQGWGYVIATVWAVKGAVYMTALSAAAIASFQRGASADLAQLAVWIPVGVASALSAVILLRACPAGMSLSQI